MEWRVEARGRVGTFELDVEIAGDHVPVAVIGPNGSGKTTLLRLIAGAYAPSSGRIVVGERTLFDSRAGVCVVPERRGVGYVPQGYGLFPHLRVLDNAAFGLSTSARRRPGVERRRAAAGLLEELGCGHLLDRFPAELSGGEQQRVALVRALVTDPDVLLLDEPLAAMDASARRVLRVLLAARLRARRRPAIVVTHDLRDVLAIEATVCVLENGRIVQRGTPGELRARPASDFVAEYFDAPLGVSTAGEDLAR